MSRNDAKNRRSGRNARDARDKTDPNPGPDRTQARPPTEPKLQRGANPSPRGTNASSRAERTRTRARSGCAGRSLRSRPSQILSIRTPNGDEKGIFWRSKSIPDPSRKEIAGLLKRDYPWEVG